MSVQPPSLSISTVTVEVPIKPATSESTNTVSLEIGKSGFRAWDNVGYTVCGEVHLFDRSAPKRRPTTEIPYFAEVFKFLSAQHAAHRADPLGAFLRPAVEVMENDLAHRDGSSVYFAEAGRRVKIGWSTRVATRLAQLQTGSADPIRLLGTEPGGRALERRLHERFASARISGEWFEPTPELLAYVGALGSPCNV